MSSRRTEWIWTAIILAVAAWFYGWTATSAGSPLTSALQIDDLYNRLADGFLAGHLGFAELPPPELANLADPYDPAQNAPFQRFHDVSYYEGRYYLYFGPVPAVVLLAPFKALTGAHLPQNLAVVVFAWGSALLGCLLVRAIRKQYFPSARSYVVICGTAAMAFGSLLPILLRRPVVYELAIASACFFGLAALLLLHRAVVSPKRQNAWLAGGSLALGLAVGCRPDFLFGAAGALAVFIWPIWRQARLAGPQAWSQCRRPVLAAVVPIGVVGLILSAYNFARFGSWGEFGTHYMLAGNNQQNMQMNSLWFAPTNLYYYVLAPPQFSAYFPFFQVTHVAPFKLPEGYSGEENTYGVLLTLPVLWALLWLWRGLRPGVDGNLAHLRRFSAITFGFAGMNAALLLTLAGAANRYMIDFIPPLFPLAWAGVFLWEARPPDALKWLGRFGWLAAFAYTLLFNVFVSLQHNELLRYHNPAAYRRLAHAFNHVSVWLGETAPAKTGPMRIRLDFPANCTGKLQPLIVTGLSFRADFLWVYYVDDRHIKIGFEHTSYGGPVTDPIEIDFAADHTLEVEMGSFYPPVEHPFYDGMASGEITRLKRTLRVALDGREILSGPYDFYDSSPGDVAVGNNPVSDAFGKRFTGRIISAEHLGLAAQR
jgi:hypothetical protein